jgi:hypothetical protein
MVVDGLIASRAGLIACYRLTARMAEVSFLVGSAIEPDASR